MNANLKNSVKTELGTANKDEVFNRIYKKYFRSVELFVVSNSGTTTDAQDLFQDVMLVLNEKLQREDFVLTAKLKTYIMAIARNLWLKTLRDSGYRESFDPKHEKNLFDEIQLSIEKENSYTHQLKKIFVKMTNHCQKLLDSIYYKMKSILEIQKEYGYSSRHNAQNQKHKCIKQLKNLKEQS